MKTIIIFLVIFLVIAGFQIYKKKFKGEINKSDFAEIGKLIYLKHKNEFEAYFNFYLKDKIAFKDQEADLLEEYEI